MAIVVLVLWLFTAGAGVYLLVTSNLARGRRAAPAPAASGPQPAPAKQPALAAGADAGQAASSRTARRELRRAARDRWDPPSLTAAKAAPVMPEARSLLEFAHPVCGLVGLGFWLGFTLVHNQALGWIGFGLVSVTACLGLGWFTANAHAAGRGDGGRPVPNFAGRLVALHGSAAVITVTLAALSALVIRG